MYLFVMNKRLIVFLIIGILLVSALSAVPSIYDIISEFPESRIDSFLEGDTVKYYSIDGNYVPEIAFDGTMGKSKAIKDYNEDDTFTLGLATFINTRIPGKTCLLKKKSLKSSILFSLSPLSRALNISPILQEISRRCSSLMPIHL